MHIQVNGEGSQYKMPGRSGRGIGKAFSCSLKESLFLWGAEDLAVFNGRTAWGGGGG